MSSDNLQYAPKPKIVDGILGVPMDIQTINAHLIFDGNTSSAAGDATINYIAGKQDGYALFDLRQTITDAWLDGVPISPGQLAHHDFGGGTNAEMRIINSLQTAGSVHTLRVQYDLAMPQTDNGGSYPPHVAWSSGPRLQFNFGFTDLRPSRYLEAFIPSNLIYDQFQLAIEVEITNTTIVHDIITNGSVTNLGTNHWSIAFPSHFTSVSFLLDIRAADTVTALTDTVLLPVSGNTVSIEAWKLRTDTTTDLTVKINNIKTFLTDNENNVGPYAHGSRFVAFLIAGGMEYDGGTTSDPLSSSTLKHETYHSWWARGVKPARQQDGWWDEGWDVYHDHGFMGSTPFNFANPPVELCPQNEWQRITASNAYGAGELFWEGVAAMIGVANLKSLMSAFYNENKRKVTATYDFETYLLCKTGNIELVNAFHHFAYGFNTPSPAPALWLRDETGDPGNNLWAGKFWNSPDLWVRNTDDGGTSHQNPEFGQDNWIYARVRNKSSVTAQHFVVAFNVKSYAGTQFVYPNDFLPCTAAVTGFNLAGNQTMVVKARWPKSFVPPEGTHSCLLASILTPGDMPNAGLHVWEHNNLAQKNLTIVDLQPNNFIVIPFVIAALKQKLKADYHLELIPHHPPFSAGYVSLIKSDKELMLKQNEERKKLKIDDVTNDIADCGYHLNHKSKNHDRIYSMQSERFKHIFPAAREILFKMESGLKIPVSINPFEQQVYGLKVMAPPKVRKGEVLKYDLVQTDSKSGKILGGIAVQINII
ncbi:MAG TPA: hypothetical protein VJY62_03765 [Bacteroidia bacterium]|nr:hypothetical protein [Bacteroidia bacterium]